MLPCQGIPPTSDYFWPMYRLDHPEKKFNALYETNYGITASVNRHENAFAAPDGCRTCCKAFADPPLRSQQGRQRSPKRFQCIQVTRDQIALLDDNTMYRTKVSEKDFVYFRKPTFSALDSRSMCCRSFSNPLLRSWQQCPHSPKRSAWM